MKTNDGLYISVRLHEREDQCPIGEVDSEMATTGCAYGFLQVILKGWKEKLFDESFWKATNRYFY